MQDKISNRTWRRLKWFDPEERLRRLRGLELKFLDLDLPRDVRELRTKELKRLREARDAALFAHGMSAVLGSKLSIAFHEADDYDCVARHPNVQGNGDVFYPVQLKELVPADRNPHQSLDSLLSGLAQKYPGRSATTVAIHVNRVGTGSSRPCACRP